MKKQQLLALLNESADSLNCHDGTLLRLNLTNNSITYVIKLGEYHYIINGLENYLTDTKNSLILTLRFDNISDIECGFYDDFRIEGCEIMDNCLEDGIFKIDLYECGYVGKMKFNFDKFKWDVIGEFDKEQLYRWYKENGYYKDAEWLN